MADPDRRTMLLASYENAAVVVSAIEPQQLSHPTPCPKYDVAGLINHLIEAGLRAAALGRGQTPPPGDESAHVELADAPAQLRRAAKEAAEAWGDDSALSSRFTMPWGEEYTGTTIHGARPRWRRSLTGPRSERPVCGPAGGSGGNTANPDDTEHDRAPTLAARV